MPLFYYHCFQVEVVGAHLLGAMMTEWGLLQELTALRNLYLTSSAGMVAWADGVLMLMEERGGLEQLEQAELECMLQVGTGSGNSNLLFAYALISKIKGDAAL